LKIKVVQISSDTNIGGAGKCILTFLDNYDRGKFDMGVVLPFNSKLKEPILSRGVAVTEVDGISDKSLSIKGIFALIRVFKTIKPDIIHTHASMSARIAGRLWGKCRIIYTRHCVYPPGRLMTKGIFKFINGAVNNLTADRIIAVAEAAKENLTAAGADGDRIEVVLNGISPVKKLSDDEKGQVRREYNIPSKNKVVSILARLEPVKGHNYFIDEAYQVAAVRDDVTFIIAGIGSAAEELKAKVAALGLEERVIFTGFVEDVSHIVNITDISVNASYGTEATSIALLEGMCLGKPAVVSDYGGNPGVIENGVNGFLFPVADAGKLAERILEILSDDELYARLSDGALKIFDERFNASVYTRGIERIYMEVFARNASKTTL